MGRWLACVIMIAGAIGCGSPTRATTDASDQPVPDAPAQTGEFGGACTKHTDCASGYCVEPLGGSGGVCTRECRDGCPEDWECRTVDLPQVDLDLCVPAAPQLCLACASDAECGGGACLPLDGGGRCATPCVDQCPTGYTCAADASGMHAGSFCQPITGSCSCSTAMDGAMRSCSTSNAVGTCFGTQTCDAASGWSACTARTATDESCNGTDDDCDFIIDDGLPGGGDSCMITNAFGSCPGVNACSGSSGFICVGKTPAAEACNYTDDDCDGTIDDGFAGLGAACTGGVGACARYGSQRCNTAGTGLECSAVPGAPDAEACNQIDDDCDSSTDETFKLPLAPMATALGSVCSAGFGVCARYGTNICRTDGAGTQCSAVADPSSLTTESCNYLDDNCDNILDNGYRDPVTGVYNTDQHCGSCGTSCSTIYNGPNAFGACQAGPSSAVCVMRCDPGSGNLNGSTVDGCEFTLDPTAIYVSTTDTTAVDDATCGLGPTGTGTGNHPCKTITQGLARATATGRAQVLVADGTYTEGVTLVNGKQLLGAYRADTWERHLSTTATVISGFTSSGNHDRTIVASNITAATVFEGFVVRGSFNSKPGGNSYAIFVSGSSASLVIRNNQIFGGRGGAGQQGMAGLSGAQGVNGTGANGPNDNNYSARSVNGCTSSMSGDPAPSVVRAFANGGVRTCNGASVSGGNGGGNWCPPSQNAALPGNQASEKSAKDGVNGATGGGGAGGAGADAGDDGYVYQDANRCVIPSNGASTFGLDGTAGAPGTSASAAQGCTSSAGTISGGHWVAGTGNGGTTGTNGGGGGGGGAGGGGYCADCRTGAMAYGDHRIGGHGGGGGSGGCGGAGGAGGGGGGGTFGVFVVGGAAPTLQANSITRGDAGTGGNGGIGGAGGLGGEGGQGGLSDLFCTDKAGRGGDGGDAGHGAGGGGGCGGSSFGIFTSGVGTPAYCATNTVIGGAAGSGGTGGFSGGNSGGAGAAGVLQDCVSL